MADETPAPNAPATSSAGLGRFAQKLGPLPIWAWAALILVGYYAYSRFRSSQSVPPGSDGASSDGTGVYVPAHDSPSGGAGSVYSPGDPPNGNGGQGSSPGASSSQAAQVAYAVAHPATQHGL